MATMSSAYLPMTLPNELARMLWSRRSPAEAAPPTLALEAIGDDRSIVPEKTAEARETALV